MASTVRPSIRTCLFLGLLLASTAGCDHFYSVSGHVRSCADERPIDGAQVSVLLAGEDGPKAELTAADGSFSMAINAPHSDEAATLDVSKSGFAKATQQVHSEQPVNVCLQPEAVAAR